MATSLPDDGIPVLTDIVDSGMSPAPVPPPPPAPAPQSDPMFKTMPMALLDAAALGAQSTGMGSRSGPPSIGGPVTPAHAAQQMYRAPPIDGPPSLSEFDVSAPPPAAVSRPAPTSHAAAASFSAPATLSAEAQERLAASVHSAVLDGLLSKVEPLLESRLKESIADILEKVLAQMTAELKTEAREIIRDAVARAVVEEMAALRSRSAQH